jgi:hypothetical protein
MLYVSGNEFTFLEIRYLVEADVTFCVDVGLNYAGLC